MTRMKANKILLPVIIGWFIIRITFLFFIHGITLFEAHDIAVNMLQTGEMKYFLNNRYNYNYQFPVYPYLLFIIYKIFGIIPKLGIILNCILHSLSALIGFRVFQWLAENCRIETVKTKASTISLLAAFGILFHPLINYYTLMIIHPFALDLFLLMLSLFFMIRYSKIQYTGNLLLLGITFGISILDRPIFAALLVPFFFFIFKNESYTKALTRSLLLLFAGIIFLSPWLYRNYTIYHKLSLSSATGQNLWLGIQEKTGGTANLPDGSNYYSLIPQEEWNVISGLNSEEQSDYFFIKYKQAIRDNPVLLFKMYIIKLKNFWTFRSNLGTEYNARIKKFIPIYKWAYSTILFLAIYFVAKAKKDMLVLFSIPVALSLFHAVFYVETRHRVIIEPILLFMAICAGYMLRSTLHRQKNV